MVLIGTGVGVLVTSGGARRSGSDARGRVARANTATPSQAVVRDGALLNRPQALAVAANGDVLIANQGTNQVLERKPDGSIVALAGSGQPGDSGDGGPARTAMLNQPAGLVVTNNGTVDIADYGNGQIRQISPDGIISTLASGLPNPEALAIGPNGTLYVADDDGIQTVGPSGAVFTVVPSTTAVNRAVINEITVGGQSMAFFPSAIASTSSGTLYVAISSPKYLLEYSNGEWRLVGAGSVEPQSGTYVTPTGLVALPDGDVLVADYGNFGVDLVRGTSLASIFAATPHSIRGLDGFRPSGIAVGPQGQIYVDTDGVNGGSNRAALIRLSSTGVPTLLAAGPIQR
jgi:hypothetical protein